jgi:hypothetical protein
VNPFSARLTTFTYLKTSHFKDKMLLFYFFPCTISILTRKFDGRDIFEEIYHTVLSGKICKMKKHSQDIKT